MKIVEFGTIRCTKDGYLKFDDFIMSEANPTPKDLLIVLIGLFQATLADLEKDGN